jgi:hypothetical protein
MAAVTEVEGRRRCRTEHAPAAPISLPLKQHLER